VIAIPCWPLRAPAWPASHDAAAPATPHVLFRPAPSRRGRQPLKPPSAIRSSVAGLCARPLRRPGTRQPQHRIYRVPGHFCLLYTGYARNPKNLPANHAKGREKRKDFPFINLAFRSRGSRVMFRCLCLFFITVAGGHGTPFFYEHQGALLTRAREKCRILTSVAESSRGSIPLLPSRGRRCSLPGRHPWTLPSLITAVPAALVLHQF